MWETAPCNCFWVVVVFDVVVVVMLVDKVKRREREILPHILLGGRASSTSMNPIHEKREEGRGEGRKLLI